MTHCPVPGNAHVDECATFVDYADGLTNCSVDSSLVRVPCLILYKKTRIDVRAAIRSHAETWTTGTLEKLDAIDAYLFADDGTSLKHLEFVLHKHKWDEASHRFAVDICPDVLIGSKRTSSWPMMISRRELIWKVRDESLKKLVIVVPPVLLLGKLTADTFYSALFCSPVPKRVRMSDVVCSKRLS